MSHNLCIVAIFGNFQDGLTFRILAVLEPFFAQNNLNVFVQKFFFACFRQFQFLTQTQYCAWAITFALWPFLAIFKMVSFLQYQLFFSHFFAQNNFDVFVRTLFACFRQLHFLTQTEYCAWAITFALWPLSVVFKMVSFFKYQLFCFPKLTIFTILRLYRACKMWKITALT